MFNYFQASLKKIHDRESESGFTLIELLVVILIIGILAAIAIPLLLNQRKAAVDASVQSDIKGVTSEIENRSLKAPTAPVNDQYLTQETTGQATAAGDVGFSANNLAIINPMSFLPSGVSQSTGFKVSPGNTIAIKGDVNQIGAYCIYGINDSGDLASRDGGITYDSLAGGLNKTGGACLAGASAKAVINEIKANSGVSTPAAPTGNVNANPACAGAVFNQKVTLINSAGTPDISANICFQQETFRGTKTLRMYTDAYNDLISIDWDIIQSDNSVVGGGNQPIQDGALNNVPGMMYITNGKSLIAKKSNFTLDNNPGQWTIAKDITIPLG